MNIDPDLDNLLLSDTVLVNLDSQNAPAATPPTPNAHTPAITDQNTIISQKLYRIRDEIDSVLRLLHNPATASDVPHMPAEHPSASLFQSTDRIVEGTFTGQKMLGTDNQEYHVPPNYASKSKLVEGDKMKLTITNNGAFIYKQISPTPRKRLVGTLTLDNTTGQWSAALPDKVYKILTASATFYRGKPGDEVIFLVPESGEAGWGAVENIIHK